MLASRSRCCEINDKPIIAGGTHIDCEIFASAEGWIGKRQAVRSNGKFDRGRRFVHGGNAVDGDIRPRFRAKLHALIRRDGGRGGIGSCRAYGATRCTSIDNVRWPRWYSIESGTQESGISAGRNQDRRISRCIGIGNAIGWQRNTRGGVARQRLGG